VSTSSDQQPHEITRGPGQPSTQEIPVVAPDAQPAAARPVTGGAHLPPPVAPGPQTRPGAPTAMQPTGPVDFVPGLPGAGILPPPPPVAAAPPPAPPIVAPAPAAEAGPAAPPTAPVASAADEPGWPHSLDPDPAPPATRTGSGRPADRRALLGLGLAALAVVLLELGLLLRFDSEPLWSTVTLWSAFATASAVLALVAFAAFYPAGNRLRSGAIWRIAAAGLVGLSVFWVLVVLPVVASDRGFVLTAALGCLGAALWIGPRRND
jgi:hypothetical protein